MSDADFTLVFLPDTQFYSQDYPSTWTSQTNWIVNNKSSLNIQAVIGEGDVVDDDLTAQWDNADAGIAVLDTDGTIPYLLAIGNHDYDGSDGSGTAKSRATTGFNALLPQSRYTSQSWWNGDFYEASKTENAYLLLTIGSVDYIIISLEFGPRDGVLTWANGLLSTYSTRRAIVVSHGIVYYDGSFTTVGDDYNASDYTLDGDINDGIQVYDSLKQNENLWLISSGHQISGSNPIGARRLDVATPGNTVHSFVANYQQITNGGNGYLRLLKVYPSKKYAEALTYSTTLDSYMATAGHQYSVFTDYEVRS